MTGLPSFDPFPVLQKDWAPHDLLISRHSRKFLFDDLLGSVRILVQRQFQSHLNHIRLLGTNLETCRHYRHRSCYLEVLNKMWSWLGATWASKVETFQRRCSGRLCHIMPQGGQNCCCPTSSKIWMTFWHLVKQGTSFIQINHDLLGEIPVNYAGSSKPNSTNNLLHWSAKLL